MNYTVRPLAYLTIAPTERKRTGLNLPIRGSIFFRKDHYFPIWFFASTFCLYGGMIAQGNVDNAPFGRRHRLKRLTPSAFGNLIRHALGHLDQLLLTAVTIPFHI